MWRWLIVPVVLVFTWFVAYKQIPKTIDQNVLWGLVQSWRSENNLPTFIEDPRACKIAETRLGEITQYFAHEGFDGSRLCDGYCKLGENLGRNTFPEKKLLRAWVESPEHLQNLVGSYTYSCIRSNDSHAVQIFANF